MLTTTTSSHIHPLDRLTRCAIAGVLLLCTLLFVTAAHADANASVNSVLKDSAISATTPKELETPPAPVSANKPAAHSDSNSDFDVDSETETETETESESESEKISDHNSDSAALNENDSLPARRAPPSTAQTVTSPQETVTSTLDADSATSPTTTPVETSEAPPLPVAEDVDLSEPVVMPNEPAAPGPPVVKPTDSPISEPPVVETEDNVPLVLLGEEVAPGTSARLSWSPDQHFDGISVPTPVLVVNGSQPGKTLCLTAAIHGDELNGIEIVRRVMYDLEPSKLSGAVIGVPIVNLQGFRRNSRYLPDRRDLNRFFPGRAGGSSASRMAHSFFSQVIRHCDALVDIHTGSFLRTNLPQLRADMSVPEVAELTEGFGATAVLHSSSTGGTLRRAAVMAGIPAVTLETGEPSRLQEKEIEHGTKGIQTLLTKLEMTRRVRVWGDPEPVYYKSVWVRADDGGLLFTSVKLGQRVRKDQILGTITDPITNVRNELVSPFDGRVLGMALNQVVLPGFATFRIGIPSNEKEVTDPATSPDTSTESTTPVIPESVPTEVDIEDENS